MEQRADSEMCCRVAKKLSLVVLIVFFVSGCGGGDSGVHCGRRQAGMQAGGPVHDAIVSLSAGDPGAEADG